MSQVSRVSINLQFSHEQESEQNETPEVEYLWGRIFVSIIVFAVIASLVLWFVVKQPEPTGVQNLPIATTEAVDVNDAVATLPQETSMAAPSISAIELSSIETPAIEFPPIEALTIETPTIETESAVVANTPEGDAEVDAGATVDLNVIADPAPPAASPTQTESAKLADIQIKSSHVNNAQLSLENKPTAADSLPAVVYVDEDQILKAHFLTEYRSLKGQLVYHDWYLNSKRVARVSARPAKDKQMAFSSKNIDNTMAGSWQVKVVDQRNTLLAIGEFEVQQLH